MKTETFNKLLDELDGNSLETLKAKNAKYASTDDCLHNFESGAEIMGSTPAHCAWGYLTKHLVALRDKVQRDDFSDREDFLEKCQDIINYIRFIWVIGNDREVANGIEDTESPRNVDDALMDEIVEDLKAPHEFDISEETCEGDHSYNPVQRAYDLLVGLCQEGKYVDLRDVIGYLGEALAEDEDEDDLEEQWNPCDDCAYWEDGVDSEWCYTCSPIKDNGCVYPPSHFRPKPKED